MLSSIELTNSTLTFLTAREPESFEFTQKNLRDIGVDTEKYKIHYSGARMTKGDYIRRHIDVIPYNKVVFIDNAFWNLQTVHMYGPQDKLDLYFFVNDSISQTDSS
jgi:hypothetical protein